MLLPPHGKQKWLVLGVALFFGVVIFSDLPDPLFGDPESAVLLARDGRLLGARIADDGQWRFPARTSVPDKYKRALLQFEDKRFPWHPGVDPIALTRATYENLSAGHIVSGGSTLTMQVIRLSRKNPDRTYLEKIREIVLALRLELARTKDEILALYAANAPYGGNVVGLEAAAWRYFGRSPDQLSWAESCMLAVLPNSPSLIHPGKNRDMLKVKRDRLINRLAETKTISKLEAELALKEPLPERPVPLPRYAPHLLETLVAQRSKQGLRFNSTLDAQLQESTQSIVGRRSRELSARGITNAAALVIDNESFEVLAYVGNSRTHELSEDGYAIDLIHRMRSTGSILKPFLYLAMLQEGEILPTTLVPDLPTQYGGFMPENYDRRYRGAVPAKTALARSLNVPAVRMLKAYGISRFYDFLGHLGMTTLHRSPDGYGLTLVLGGSEATLWDVTAMYGNMAHRAGSFDDDKNPNYLSLKILTSDSARTERTAGYGPGAAWLTIDALREVARPEQESTWKNFSSSRRIAWKTGTSFGLRDAWAIGSNRRYTVGVWVGNSGGEGRPDLTGVGSAAPVLFDIFNRLDDSAWFERPEYDLKQVRVCARDGYLASEYCATDLQFAPLASHFSKLSPYHRAVHLDSKERYRVHNGCEPLSGVKRANWFVLPPGQEYFYRKQHPEYRPLPAWRKDCVGATQQAQRGPIEFLYPHKDTSLYIPIDLAGQKGSTVFEVVHTDQGALLYWHLDEVYIGSTRDFHKMSLQIAPGEHTVIVVDQEGNQASRTFTVLDKDKKSS